MDRKRIGAFVLGSLTGALAGILLAPRSGREVRSTIANRAGEARERSRETYFDAQERMAERLSGRPQRGAPAEGPAPTLGPRPVPSDPQDTVPPTDEPPLDPGPEAERPVLRDVSLDAPREAEPAEDERSEELRRRVQETRARLRARLEEHEE